MNKKVYSFFAVIGMAIAIGTAAFTAPKKSNMDPWYEVTISGTDTDPEANQHIGDQLEGEPSGDCRHENGILCAVQFSANEPLIPSTVAEAKSLEVPIIGEAFRLN